MAKSTHGGKAKATSGEPKARRAPARRTTKKSAETPIAMASELAIPEQSATAPPAVMASASTKFSSSNATADLSAEAVRRRAFEIFVARGGTNGCDVDDWLEAERQLRNGRAH